MNIFDRRPLDRDLAEQLLRGVPSASSSARHLAERLAAASINALPSELAGEQAVVAVFRAAAHLDPVSQPGRPSMIKTAIAKALTLKAAAVLAALSAGGVAVAASTGVLPNPLQEQPAPAHSTPAKDHPAAGSPSPNMRGLCTAFMAGAGSEHGKALESPAFSALISTAGGKDSVESYCTTLLASPAGKAPGDHPTGAPEGHGTNAPAPHVTGTPARPTGAPTPSHRG